MRLWSQNVSRERWTPLAREGGQRVVADETPVAIVHDASTTAVLMASPNDIEDLAVGFSMTEGLIDSPDQIQAMEVVDGDLGLEARLWLTSDRSHRLAARRRQIVGPTGCGLCGVDSLAQAAPPPPVIRHTLTVSPIDLLSAMNDLSASQVLGRETRAAHAAGFWTPDRGLRALREDVGRHNALDKLAGALARSSISGPGVVLLTSRVSVEMVQKTAAMGAPILCAVSAPTGLAIRTAQAAGLTLVAIARHDGFEIFTGAHRIVAR